MWREDKVPLKDFYSACKASLHRSGFKLLFCLVSRKADAPKVFDELRTNWSSFHDVTGADILFMFAGDNLNQIQHNSHILYDDYSNRDNAEHNYRGPETAIVYSSSAIIAGDYINRIGPRFFNPKNIEKECPRIKAEENFEDRHTLEIKKLAEHLKIRERDIPCLNIVLLKYGLSINIPIDPEKSFYQLVKNICADFADADIRTYNGSRANQEANNIKVRKSLIEKKIDLLKQGAHRITGYDVWLARWSQEEAYQKNEALQNAISVMDKLPFVSSKEVSISVHIFKTHLPDSRRFQKMAAHLGRYYEKHTPEKARRLIEELEAGLEIQENSLKSIDFTPMHEKFWDKFISQVYSNQYFTGNFENKASVKRESIELNPFQMPDFQIEKRKAFNTEYLKVFLKDKSRMEEIRLLLNDLPSVKTANITDNKETDLTVYPSKTSSVDEMKTEVIEALSVIFSGKPGDPIIKDELLDGISDSIYKQILQKISYFGKNLEKLTSIHSVLDEEGFRAFFLPFLNAISVTHTATGETFNKIGKTDILIQNQKGENVFIAECKVWSGEAEVPKALDQLLERYVNWRDEKLALIIFNKTVKGFTAIIDKAIDALKKHPSFKQFKGSTEAGRGSFVFQHPEDKDKTVDLELIMFNCTS